MKKIKTNDSNKFIMYLDANNLYGHSMSKPLPYKNFIWSDDLTLDPKNLQTGIYVVDIEIPKELHSPHSCFIFFWYSRGPALESGEA